MMRSRSARARVLGWCLIVSCTLGTGSAAAEATPEERALSTTLFNEAKILLDAGRVTEACRKLEESQRIHFAGGTLLNLAVCHEKEGKTATAWTEFRAARVVAARDKRDDRVKLADEHIKALEPKLSKLVIRVPPANDAPDVILTVDSHAIRRAAWGTPAPVDPGEHVVEASAPGKKRWTARVTILPDGDVKTIEIPAWEDEAPAATPHAPPAPALVPPVVASGERSSPAPSPPRSRGPALALGTIGIGGVAMGSYFGLRAASKHNDPNAVCTSADCSQSIALNDSAKTAADIATVSFVVGAIGLGVGAYLWFFGGESRTSARTVRVMPALGPGRGTVDLTGTF